MLTREVREWLEKVKRGSYSNEDAMGEFENIARYLTREELVMIKNDLINSYKGKI